MPISPIDGFPPDHWNDVRVILMDAIKNAGFEVDLVSNADESSVIQKTIIQNLYKNPIAVCDVSARNANVMFELGMRLAFNKPTIIVKDDQTPYTFDMQVIEHLVYPRSLRHGQIEEFKELLAKKVKATHKKATEDKDYTTFLKNFGEFTVAKLESKEVSPSQAVLEEFKDMRQGFARLTSLIQSYLPPKMDLPPGMSRSAEYIVAHEKFYGGGYPSPIDSPSQALTVRETALLRDMISRNLDSLPPDHVLDAFRMTTTLEARANVELGLNITPRVIFLLVVEIAQAKGIKLKE